MSKKKSPAPTFPLKLINMRLLRWGVVISTVRSGRKKGDLKVRARTGRNAYPGKGSSMKTTKKAKKRRFEVDEVMETWRSLMRRITTMSEAELLEALKSEAAKPRDERRDDIIIRLHRKYNRVRQARELQEFLT